MKPLEIKAARVRLGLNQKDVSRMMGINTGAYQAKERGARKFSEDEKFQLAEILQLTPEQINDFLFDGRLPVIYKDQHGE